MELIVVAIDTENVMEVLMQGEMAQEWFLLCV